MPALQWILFERRFFQSDGSAAGLVMFMMYAGVGLASASIGIMFAGSAVRRIASGESGRALLTRGQAMGLIVVILAGVAGLLGYRYHASQPYKPDRAQATEDRVQRVVTVRVAYALAWQSRHGAPALRLDIPEGDLAREDATTPPAIQETRDGPLVLRLALADAPRATLELHRDDYFVGDAILTGLDGPANRSLATPEHFWVRREGGGWKLLGISCKERTAADFPAVRCYRPDAPLVRWVPAAFGLENVRLHAAQESQTCNMAFRYRERIVKIGGPGRCFAAPSLAALASAVDLLDRLGRDSAAPPGAPARMARVVELVGQCEAAAKAAPEPGAAGLAAHEARDRIDGICARARALAVAELGASPAEAAPLALRAVDAAGEARGRSQVPAIDAVLLALANAGRGETREALRAHVLRIARGGEHEPSSQAIVALAPKLLAADDPLFDAIERLPFADAPRKLALLQAWHDKAAASAPGSDLVLKTRYRLCTARLSANVERESLRGCADELMAAWERRIAEGKPFDLFNGEGELAGAIARMYYVHGYASEDFAGALAGVRRVEQLGQQRFAASAEYAYFFAMLRDLGTQLAGKLPR